MFKKLEETSKLLIYFSVLISLLFGILGVVLINEKAAYAQNIDFKTLIGGRAEFLLGLLIGAAFTVIKIILIDRSCKKVLDMDTGMGKLYGTGQYFSRFLMTAAVLVAAIMIAQIGFIGTFLGIISLQLAGYLVPVWEKRKNTVSMKQ